MIKINNSNDENNGLTINNYKTIEKYEEEKN
jgi:hypothetical protein